MKNQILIKGTNFQKLKKEIQNNKDKKIIFSSNNDDVNRQVVEKEKIDVLLLNQSLRKDRFKQRDSGFNQVLAKLAKKKNIIIGINLDELLDSKKKIKAEILARVKQNIKLCNKNRLKMKFVSSEKNERNIYDLKALGLVLGMPTWMTKEL